MTCCRDQHILWHVTKWNYLCSPFQGCISPKSGAAAGWSYRELDLLEHPLQSAVCIGQSVGSKQHYISEIDGPASNTCLVKHNFLCALKIRITNFDLYYIFYLFVITLKGRKLLSRERLYSVLC